MPHSPKTKYENGKIYKITNTVDDSVYVGSTVQQLSQRLAKHRHSAKAQPNVALYAHSKTIGWDKMKIILVESYPCKSKEELFAREDYYIREIGKGKLNSKHAVLDEQNDKAKNRIRCAKRWARTKDESNAKRRGKVDCECGTTVSIANRARHLRSSQHQLNT